MTADQSSNWPRDILNYIDGELSAGSDDQWLENFEPATGQSDSRVVNSSPEDVDRAARSALRGAEIWNQATIDFRSQWLFRLADALEKNSDRFAAAESHDSGKPEWLAKQIEIPRSVQNLRFFAGLIQGTAAASHDSPQALNVSLSQPWGVGATISPWNLPLYLFTWKIAPALAAGNCVVAKPSELTPRTAMMLGELAREIDFPAGVLNIVQGSGSRTGQALIEHPAVRAISFTGGTTTGGKIAATVAPQFKKLALELGGKNPVLIFEDCDWERAIQTTLRSSFQNQGQICLCGSRIYIQESVYSRFVEQFVMSARQWKVGDPRESDTKVGAVVSAAHQAKIMAAIEGACRDGGKILCGGQAPRIAGRCAGGWFVEPTVLESVPQHCAANQEEIFGPVVTVQPFRDESQAIALANDSRYGLSATIWTRDLERAVKVGKQVQSGVIWVNGWLHRDLRTPFGGMKQSGVGREGGWDALEFWSQKKNLCFCW